MCTRHLLYGRHMKRVEGWASILRQAWSVRLALLSALLSALEIAMPYILPGMPDRLAASLALVVALGAAAARIVAQPKMHKVDE